MDARTIVERLMSTSSKSSLSKTVDDYLKVFGVVRVSTDLPVVFDPQYAGVWNAFLTDRQINDQKLRLLVTILDFLTFMKSQRVDPFLKKTRIDVPKVLKAVIAQQVKDDQQVVFTYLRKTGVLLFLSIRRKLVRAAADGRSLTVYLDLVPNKSRDTVHNVVPQLKNILYRSDVPPQLKTPRRYTTVIDTYAPPNIWLPLTVLTGLRFYVTLAVDSVVMKIVVPIDTETVDKRALPALTTLWKQFRT